MQFLTVNPNKPLRFSHKHISPGTMTTNKTGGHVVIMPWNQGRKNNKVEWNVRSRWMNNYALYAGADTSLPRSVGIVQPPHHMTWPAMRGSRTHHHPPTSLVILTEFYSEWFDGHFQFRAGFLSINHTCCPFHKYHHHRYINQQQDTKCMVMASHHGISNTENSSERYA